MKKNIFSIAFLASLAFALAVSCAKEAEESDDDVQKRILDAYVQLNCPGATITKSGLVVLSRQEGTGTKPIQGKNGAYITYSTQMLDGTYSQHNIKDLAVAMGDFSNSTYYGPKLFLFGIGNTIIGIEEALEGLTKGGKTSVIIPPWLSEYNRQNTGGVVSTGQRENAVNFIYNLEVKEVIDSIVKFETDTLEAYRDKYYPGVDSVSQGFYFKKLKAVEGDTIKSDKNVNVWYIGRLLDGFVFDTNIADTAKKYGIYSSSGTYTAMSIAYSETYKTMQENNSVVTGFARALKRMRYGEEAVTFFCSDYGYGYSGSGDAIGPYQPLVFYLKLEDNDEEEEEGDDSSSSGKEEK